MASRLLLLPGAVLTLVGIALSAQFTFTGPTLPTTPLGWVGWVLVVAGLLEMKLVAGLVE